MKQKHFSPWEIQDCVKGAARIVYGVARANAALRLLDEAGEARLRKESQFRYLMRLPESDEQRLALELFEMHFAVVTAYSEDFINYYQSAEE
jgi:hypothetical protein